MAKQHQPKEWHKLSQWGALTIVVAFLAHMLWAIRSSPDDNFGMIIWLVIAAGIVLAVIGAIKNSGALRAGVVTLIAGASSWILGQLLKVVEPSQVLSNGGDFLAYTGLLLGGYGALMFIMGLAIAIVGYLRRVLKAVEGKSAAGN